MRGRLLSALTITKVTVDIMNPKTVLRLAIVSSENRYRGALAEAAMLQDWSGRAFHVCSAGLDEREGRPPHEMARAAALAGGLLTLETHLSRRLSDAVLSDADLILVMDEVQESEVLLRMPKFTGRVYRLGKWRNANIPNPLLGTGFAGDECLELIRACLDDWALRLTAGGLLPLLTAEDEGAMSDGYRNAG